MFDAKQCIIYTCYFLVIFKDDLVLHDEQFGTKEKCPGVGVVHSMLNKTHLLNMHILCL